MLTPGNRQRLQQQITHNFWEKSTTQTVNISKSKQSQICGVLAFAFGMFGRDVGGGVVCGRKSHVCVCIYILVFLSFANARRKAAGVNCE